MGVCVGHSGHVVFTCIFCMTDIFVKLYSVKSNFSVSTLAIFRLLATLPSPLQHKIVCFPFLPWSHFSYMLPVCGTYDLSSSLLPLLHPSHFSVFCQFSELWRDLLLTSTNAVYSASIFISNHASVSLTVFL